MYRGGLTVAINRILVPLDGSELAEQALGIAREIAAAARAGVILVRVIPPLPLLWPGPGPEIEAQLKAEAEAYLEKVAGQLRDGVAEVEPVVVNAADVPGAIRDQARLKGADLIVMSTHGHSGLGRWVYGSVTEGVLARSPVPVIAVRASQRPRPFSPATRPPRILVPLDGSEFGEAAVPVATELARALNGTLVLTEVVWLGAPEPPGSVRPTVEQQLDDARVYLERLAARLRSQGVKATTELEVGFSVVDHLLEVARRVDADLIALSTHGRTGLVGILFGSVTLGLLRRSDLPLLVVRPELMARREPEKVEAAAAPAGSEPARQLELTGREAAILASALKSFADIYPAGDPLRDEVRVLLAKLKSGPATRRSG
jgi:nucleotide-binding universal stress UspA family protein